VCASCGTVEAETPAPPPDAYGASYYERSYLAFYDERVAFLKRLLGRFRGGGLALDCGCGSGLALDVLARAGWRPVGVEPSSAGARLAAQGGQAVIRGSASGLPAASGTAGFVVLLDVLAHLDDPAAAVREAARVLAPGGRVLVKTPHRPPWAYRFASLLPRGIGRGLVHLPHQRYAISRRGLVRVLQGAGFRDIQVRPSREAIRLRSRLRKGAGVRAVLVAGLEAFYGRASSVATGLAGVTP
jgi:SAM-dependent methyltransferase